MVTVHNLSAQRSLSDSSTLSPGCWQERLESDALHILLPLVHYSHANKLMEVLRFISSDCQS